MGRIVLLVLLVVVAFWLIKRAIARGRRDPPPAASPGGELVRCARCGVHLPRAEARSAAGLEYCSDEHARLGPGDGA